MNRYTLIFLIMIVMATCSLFFTFETQVIPPDIKKELKIVATKSYLEKEILIAIETENSDDVDMYLKLVKFLDINLSDEVNNSIDKYNGTFTSSWRNTKEFSKSFISGESDSSIGLAGSVTSDMMVVGDIRDLSTEGSNFVSGVEYDKFILGVATLGVGMSVSQVFSAGSSTPFKIGASIIKFAKKSGKISKPFINIISSKLTKSIDFSALKKIDFTSTSKISESFKSFSKTINFSHTNKLFEKVNILRKNTSSIDTVSLLKYVDNQKDLNKIVKLSNKFGENTKGILKVLGKGALKTGKTVIKYTSLFIAELVSLLISSVLFILSFFSKVSFLRKIF